MSIWQELIDYSQACILGTEISGKKHIWACQRFLRDMDRVGTEDFPYIWDEGEAERIVDWFAHLRHTKGILAKKPICLVPWQKFVLCQIYGWRHKDTGKRRFRLSFVEVGRKNAKSQMEAGVALYEISVTATKNGEISEAYCAGTKREQSEIVFNEAKNMLVGSPLRGKFKVRQTKIEHIKTRSFFSPLCKDDGKNGDGTNPALLILDEYHQHKTTEFYDLGLGGNSKEPLLMIITTAGMDLTYPCYMQEYEYCSRLLDPNVDIENDEYFVDICEIDKDDDINDEKNWFKANPIRMSYPEGVKLIRDAFAVAREIPEKMTAFLTKCLNFWVQQSENGYMDMEKWKRCEVKEIPYDLRKKAVYIGFDMSAKIDLTSVAFIIPIQDGDRVVYVCFSHSFIPNYAKLRERIAKDKVPYDAWERLGYLTVTNSEIVDQNVVMEYVLTTCKENEWVIEELCFDPTNASKLMMDLSNEGYLVEEVYQSPKSLNESTAGYREQVYCQNVMYTKNPLLNFAMSNTVIKTTNGMIKIDKDKATKRIDPIDAMLCAFKLAMYHEFVNGQAVEDWLKSDEW